MFVILLKNNNFKDKILIKIEIQNFITIVLIDVITQSK